MNKNISLKLEGGGLRGAFTLGVLESFMENDINIDDVTGISAGSITGAFYVASMKNMIDKFIKLGKELPEEKIGFMDLDLSKEIPIFTDYFDYDYDSYLSSSKNLKIGTFNILTGDMVYFSKNRNIDMNEFWLEIMASSSLPAISPPIKIDNMILYDGGVKEPIPVDLNGDKEIIVLTQDYYYRKDTGSAVKKNLENRYRKILFSFPKIRDIILSRNEKYNKTLEKIIQEENKGNVFVFRPTEKVLVSTFDTNLDEVYKLYLDGKNQGDKRIKELKEFIGK